MHCQQGLGTEGRLRNEEQEQCFDKAAVTGITARMSNHIPWRLRAGQLQVGRTRALTAFLSLDLKKKKGSGGKRDKLLSRTRDRAAPARSAKEELQM